MRVKSLTSSFAGSLLFLAACSVLAHAQTVEPADMTVQEFEVSINAADVVRTMDPRRIGGTNIALWTDAWVYDDPKIIQWMAEMRPGIIRIPGGSWANAYYWNGYGVRGDDGKVDPSRIGEDGYPAVDYSGYAKGFMVNSKTLAPSAGFSGNVDVKKLHEFVRAIPGAEPMPCLNAGTGRPVDAAEWVRWANGDNGFHATLWEIGNELDGSWEPGHYQPDGSRVTGEIYTKRFNAMAKAMREVDPAIKIGGCAFPKEMIRDCGDYVDFVSIHAYPGTRAVSSQDNLNEIEVVVKREVDKMKGYIQEFQPQRKDKIELSFTEWNTGFSLNGSDVMSGLWIARFLSQMAENDIDFATQWDVFTHVKGMKEAHGLLYLDGRKVVRKAGYYAMWMWNNFTGDQMLRSAATPAKGLYTFASQSEDAVYVMLTNISYDRPARVKVNITGADLGKAGQWVSFNSRNYFWNPFTLAPEWSVPPVPTRLEAGNSFTVEVPPFTLAVAKIPLSGAPEPVFAAAPSAPATGPELVFVLPQSIYQGDRTVGYVVARAAGTTEPYLAPLKPAVLSADKPVTFDRTEVRMDEVVGRFVFSAQEEGPLILKAALGDKTVAQTIEVKTSVPKPVIYWDFVKALPSDKKIFGSDFQLTGDMSLRANKEVARIDLPGEGVPPEAQKRTLLSVKAMPDEKLLDRSNIRGIVFDMLARDVVSDDPDATIRIIMQSQSNYWIDLGTVPLSEALEWKTFEVVTDNKKYISDFPGTYQFWFTINSRYPISGTLYIDRVGFMTR